MSKLRPVANRYAQALAETISSDAELDQVRGDLHRLDSVIGQSKELTRALSNPVIAPESKLKVMKTVAQRVNAGAKTVRFLQVLAHHDRLEMIPDVAVAVDEIHNERSRVRKVFITSAAPLEDDLRARLTSALEKVAGGRVEVDITVDPSLMGGLVARIGTKVYDASLKTKLEQLRSRMVSEGARLAG